MQSRINSKDKVGHRDRLRNRFLAGEEDSYTDEALLELLLTYAIPQKDVKKLAKLLVVKFGNLDNVLAADIQTLCDVEGIKVYSAILLKLINWIRLTHSSAMFPAGESVQQGAEQIAFLESYEKKASNVKSTAKRSMKIPHRRGTGLFGKAVLKEAIELVPKLQDVHTVDEVREFLRKNLHFSAQETRRRYSDYIALRMFPDGHVDKPFLSFAVRYVGRQELKDVCFYRFCTAEPLMFDVIENLFLPAIGVGRLKRERLREYLQQRFPSSKSIGDSAKAIVDALTAGGVASADHATINFSFRDISLPSFAFIVHSEFPEPGMYDIAKLETNRAIRALFWNPTRLMPALYELRNHGFISKISEIDNVRQFTMRWTLDEIATKMFSDKGRA